MKTVKKESDNLSHNHTASLLQLAHHARQKGIDHLLDRVVLLLVLVLVVLLAGVLVMRRGLLVVAARGHISRSTGEVDIDTTGVFLGGILQTQTAADLFDAGFDFLDVVCRVVAFADDAVVALLSISLYQSRPMEKRRLTHGDGSVHATWHNESDPLGYPPPPRQTDRGDQWYPPQRVHWRYSPGR